MCRSRLAHLTLAALVALLLAAPQADARPRHARKGAPKSGEASRTVTRTAPDGTSRTSTHDTTWERGDDRWTRDTVHTGPNGKQSTTHVDGSYDPATRTWTKDVTHTRPDGSTARKQVTRQVTPVTQEPPAAD